MSSISGKLVVLILMAVGGTLYVIVRGLSSWIGKRSVLGAIEEIKRDPRKAQHLSETHDIVYGHRRNFTSGHFDELRKFVNSATSIGDYYIVYCNTLNSNRMLVFTRLTFMDYDITMTGKTDDTRKTTFVNFTLQYDHEQEELRVYSDVHYDTTQKFQKEGFFRTLFPG